LHRPRLQEVLMKVPSSQLRTKAPHGSERKWSSP
jgi:hypothetical protein